MYLIKIKYKYIFLIIPLYYRFEKLNLPALHLQDSYMESLDVFMKEVDFLYDHYNEYRQTPQIPRNFPPVSGRIVWFRQLSSRLSEPMDIFEVRQTLSTFILNCMVNNLI